VMLSVQLSTRYPKLNSYIAREALFWLRKTASPKLELRGHAVRHDTEKQFLTRRRRRREGSHLAAPMRSVRPWLVCQL
jgi:hypothetical protein